MTLFQLLSSDERVIVLSDEGTHTVYTWNRSATLQCWQQRKMSRFTIDDNRVETNFLDEWEEVAIQTLDRQLTYEQAREAAINWHHN